MHKYFGECTGPAYRSSVQYSRGLRESQTSDRGFSATYESENDAEEHLRFQCCFVYDTRHHEKLLDPRRVCTVEGVARRDLATLTDAEQRAVRLICEIRSQIAAGTISEELNAPARLAHYVISAYHGYPQLRMSRLASALGVSLRTLEREFRGVFRASMKSYQIESRLTFAQYLLSSSPDLKIGVIAKHLGYNDPNVFERFFRVQTGVSPHAWRMSEQAQRMRQEQKQE